MAINLLDFPLLTSLYSIAENADPREDAEEKGHFTSREASTLTGRSTRGASESLIHAQPCSRIGSAMDQTPSLFL
jgi:hypothetical protein